ncbi:MAG: TrkH family potassium uptake protein [Alphaproteobacteria bacterium]|nr:TrkH family potassium uptake protein [Alphaproteobacteria bacterium]
MLDLRTVLFLLGVLLSLMAAVMLVPLSLDYLIYETQHWQGFAISSFMCGFVGTLLAVSNQPDGHIELGVREAFLLTSMLWGVSSFVSALPFYFSTLSISFIDALFEATSALTTTGATVLVGLDAMPKSILLWRAMLQWLGGIGIIVMAMIIFPILRIGGMQLFRSEFSDRSDKILPRVSQIASGIFSVYSILTLLCMFFLYMAGMEPFDSLCHAMATLSTGGLSTHDSSIQAFHSWEIELILAIFMILGGGTLILYVRVWQKDVRGLFRDPQYRFYLLTILGSGTLLSLWYMNTNNITIMSSVRYSFFSVISVLTTTGFSVSDYTLWGTFPGMLMVILGLMGGCTGSTSGGIKIFRIQVFLSFAFAHLKQLRRVHGVYIPIYKGQKLHEGIALSVFIFIALYIVCTLFLAVALSCFDLNFTTAFTGAVGAISNLGVGIGKIVGPSGSFASIAPGAKLCLMFGMLLGRLELLTVLVLFLPSFWRN